MTNMKRAKSGVGPLMLAAVMTFVGCSGNSDRGEKATNHGKELTRQESVYKTSEAGYEEPSERNEHKKPKVVYSMYYYDFNHFLNEPAVLHFSLNEHMSSLTI